MDALDAIRRRRGVRRYDDRPVSDADLERILRLALLAPTAHNAQAWSFVVVRDAERRARPADLVLRGAHYLTPLGYPGEFPIGLRPEAAASRRPWRSLVHDEQWGSPRVLEPQVA